MTLLNTLNRILKVIDLKSTFFIKITERVSRQCFIFVPPEKEIQKWSINLKCINQANIYLFKVNNRNTSKRCEILQS